MMKKFLLLSYCLIVTAITANAQNNALAFDGVDDAVTVPAASARIANVSGISLTTWVYPTNPAPTFPNFDGFAGIRNNTDADFYLLHFSANSIEARFRGASGVNYDIIAPVLTLNQWVHLALVYDGNWLKLYKNGIVYDSTAASDVISNTTVDFLIGNLVFQFTNYYLSGRVDEVSLWSRALTATELACLPANGIDVATATNLELYYRCNQGVAGGNNTAISSLTDATGNINGTLSGFALNGATSNFVAGASQVTNTTAFKCPDVSFLWNGNVYTSPGIYTDTLTNSFGCDSVIQLTLNAISVDTSVTQNGATLTANVNVLNYQWLDCNNNFAPIQGATSKTYTATANGSYAVIVQQSGCFDTSSCRTVTTVSLEDQLFEAAVKVYPTITNGEVNIDFGTAYPLVQLELTDLSGRTLLTEQVKQVRRYQLDLTSLQSGVYQLLLSDGKGKMIVRLIRQ
jgi:hypothetical protein